MPGPIEALRARYRSHTWEPVGIGHSDALVWRLAGPTELFVKVGNQLEREAEALAWLAGFDTGTPAIEAAGALDDGRAYLVTTAVPGRSGAEPWPEPDRKAVVQAIGRYLARFHTLPVDQCPFRTGTDPEDPVVCHGDYMLPNVILDPRTLTVNGVIDVGALGVADRGRDIHDMVWSLTAGLNPQYGEAYADRFRAAATSVAA
ncbi:phosphotransferase [Glycomyces niveus]|uniref:Phosphotransferase n=1 Tax=Glycomyces niveus TaxID=2820287 RepID=A0ABS3U2D8_9ACTN|nr:phosphotransferase [Glycomyces sp. NEAU-S30]MBO3732890.1 phosphotransferase [Glycomyces sp. NEAU-S30]